jgi:hypothetical protein
LGPLYQDARRRLRSSAGTIERLARKVDYLVEVRSHRPGVHAGLREPRSFRRPNDEHCLLRRIGRGRNKPRLAFGRGIPPAGDNPRCAARDLPQPTPGVNAGPMIGCDCEPRRRLVAVRRRRHSRSPAPLTEHDQRHIVRLMRLAILRRLLHPLPRQRADRRRRLRRRARPQERDDLVH